MTASPHSTGLPYWSFSHLPDKFGRTNLFHRTPPGNKVPSNCPTRPAVDMVSPPLLVTAMPSVPSGKGGVSPIEESEACGHVAPQTPPNSVVTSREPQSSLLQPGSQTQRGKENLEGWSRPRVSPRWQALGCSETTCFLEPTPSQPLPPYRSSLIKSPSSRSGWTARPDAFHFLTEFLLPTSLGSPP